MRIHTDRLHLSDIYSAAVIARVFADVTEHGSRSRAVAFNVTLSGDSRRRVNAGTSRTIDRFNRPHAATWDQWGVFLAVLFEADANRHGRGMFTPYDASAEHFAARTADRFGAPEDTVDPDDNGAGYVRRFVAYGWPEDAHGDHSWQRPGRPGKRQCRHCSAEERWGGTLAQYLS